MVDWGLRFVVARRILAACSEVVRRVAREVLMMQAGVSCTHSPCQERAIGVLWGCDWSMEALETANRFIWDNRGCFISVQARFCRDGPNGDLQH